MCGGGVRFEHPRADLALHSLPDEECLAKALARHMRDTWLARPSPPTATLRDHQGGWPSAEA